MTDIVDQLTAEWPGLLVEGHWVDDYDAMEKQRADAAEEIKRLREILRYIKAHGDERGKVPHSWGQEYAERFIKLAKQALEKNDD